MTVTAPIIESQINNAFYVSPGAFATIQAAIDYARTLNGGVGQIVIGQGATTSENIATLTGGTANIYLTDLRSALTQSYVWSGTGFVPANFVQLGTIASPVGNFTNLMAVAANFDTLSTTQLVADTGEFATSITAPAANLDTITAQTGEFDAITADTGEFATSITAPTATIPDLTGNVTVEGLLKGMKKIRAYGFMPIDLTAAHVSIGTSNGGTIPIASFTDAAAPVNQKIWSIAALTDQMLFTCDDDNGTNYPWMTVNRNGHNATGITLAAPLTLPGDPTLPAQAATKNYVDDAIAESGNFVYPGAGVTVSTGSAWATPINPATLARYPAAGIALSTGSAWGTPINPANVAMLDAARNTFSGSMSIQGTANVGNPIGSTGWVFGIYTPSGPASFGMQSGNDTWAILSASSMGSPGFIWDGNHDMTFATSTQSNGLGYNPLLTITKTGNASLVGAFNSNGNIKGKTICATGSDPQGSAFNMDYSPTGDGAAWGRMLAVSAAASNVAPDMLLISLSGDGSSYHEFLRYRAASNTVIITGDMNGPGNIKFNSGTFIGCGVKDANSAATAGFTMNGSNMYLDVQGASPEIVADMHFRVFNQGASTIIEALTLASNGDAHVYGTLSAGTKSFRIPHPLDKKKMLTHGSLEGPEHGVFYRGEVKCSKGQATVTLPDYFEALTEKEGRTVLLTQIDDDSIDFAMLTATRISKGRFIIKSSEKDATVYWEVKATRAHTPIAVVSEREKAA